MEKYRILQVCVDLDGGGIDRYLYNYCTRIDDIHFDFVKVNRGFKGMLESLLESRGSKIYSVPPLRSSFKENYQILRNIMKLNHYDAIHVHLGYMGFLSLFCAKQCGIKTRIVHAHIANEPENFFQKLKRKFFTPLTMFLSTHLAGCGIDAVKWQWGDRLYEKGQLKVINNAIDSKLFSYDSDMRKKKRDEFGLKDDDIVFANIGRIGYQKNQLRLLEIFAEIKLRYPNSQLWLIGNREYSDEEWNSKVYNLKIGKELKMMGVRSDVPELLNAIDAFIFPSRYEGLPFTLVETQCNGLPSISSDSVTHYVKLGDELIFKSLKDTNEDWAITAISAARKGHNFNGVNNIIEAGYDLDTEALKLKDYYIKAIQNAK